MALDDDSAQAEQAGAIVTAVIDPTLEPFDDRKCDQCSQASEQIALEFLAQKSGEHLRQPLRRLQRHVTDEAVADDDIGLALVDAVPFDVANEIQPRTRKQFGSPLDHIVPLDFFFADVQDTDARPVAVLDCGNQRSAHDPEL